MLALTSPAQAFQITAIDSATSLTVTPAASPAIPAGTKFAILLSDSLSVDGLAQDIAETLTMYQRYMGGFADVMNGSGDVTITINGSPLPYLVRNRWQRKAPTAISPPSAGSPLRSASRRAEPAQRMLPGCVRRLIWTICICEETGTFRTSKAKRPRAITWASMPARICGTCGKTRMPPHG
ncbi:Hypothetical protein ABZS17I87_02890 [Kosakonia cowanii]